MYRKLGMAVVAALALTVGSAWAADLDTDGTVPSIIATDTTFTSAAGNIHANNQNIDVTINSGVAMTVGDVASPVAIDWTLGNLALTDGTSALIFRDIAKMNELTLTGTLGMANGGIVNLGGGATGPAITALTVGGFAANSYGMLNIGAVGEYAAFTVNNAATLGTTANAFTIAYGAGANAAGTIVDFTAGLTATNVVMTNGAGTGTFTAGALTVAGAFTQAAGINMTVAGATAVNQGATFTVAAATNTLTGAVTVNGTMQTSGAAAVTVAAAGGITVGATGTLKTASGADLTTTGGNVGVLAGGRIDIADGTTFTTTNLSNAGTIETNASGALVTTGTFTQTAGATTIGATSTASIIGGAAAINGGTFTMAAGSTVVLMGNLTVGTTTTAASFGGAGNVNMGMRSVTVGTKGSVFTDGGALTIAITGGGGGVVFAAGSTISIADDGAGTAYTLNVTSAGNISLDKDTKVLMASGGAFTAPTAIITSGGALAYTGGVAQDFLDANSGTGSASSNYTYTADAQNIFVESTAIAKGSGASYNNIIRNMNGLGVRNPGAMVYGSFGDALFDFSAGTLNDGSAQGELTESIMDRLAGNAGYNFANAAEADASANNMSGKTDVLPMATVVHTQQLAFGNIGKQLSFANATQDLAFGQTAFSSANGLASAAFNCGSSVNRFWLGGFGLWEDADRRNGDAGYKYESGGFMLGYDRTFRNNITVGAAFGYTHGDFKARAALSNDSDIDTYSFNLYAQYKAANGIFGQLMAAYAYSDNDMGTMYAVNTWDRSDYHVGTWSIGGKLGYEWKPLANLTVTPSAGLYYYNARSNRYNSTVKNGLKLKQDVTEMPIDLAFTYDVLRDCNRKLSLSANVGWAYAFDDDGPETSFRYNGIANSPLVDVEGRKPGRHTFKTGAGVRYLVRRFEVAVDYDYRRRADFDAHGVYGSFGIRF